VTGAVRHVEEDAEIGTGSMLMDSKSKIADELRLMRKDIKRLANVLEELLKRKEV
jgi:hypothetical protein